MPKKIVILGAGISGLSLAWFLSEKLGHQVDLQILEAANRTGGWIQTIYEKGFLFELGPRSCRTTGSGIETLKLVEALGLQDEVVVADATAHKRFLYVDQKLEVLPYNVASFFKSPLFLPICKAIFQDLIASKGKKTDESIYEFTKRRFGNRAAELFLDPMTSGIYAGDIHRLSVKSCYAILKECEDRARSVILGLLFRSKKVREGDSPFIQKMVKHSLFSFREGMETLTKRLAERLKERIVLGQKIRSIRELEGVDHIISTLPMTALANICESSPLSDLLKEGEATSVAVVNFGFKCNLLKDKGFGYLIPRSEGEIALGVVWDSCIFREQNRYPNETRLTVILGGAHMKNFHEHSPQHFIDLAKKTLAKHLQIDQEPDALHVKICKEAIPQYFVGHKERLNRIEAYLPKNLKILGSSYYGVSVNDCIAQAARFSVDFLQNELGKKSNLKSPVFESTSV